MKTKKSKTMNITVVHDGFHGHNEFRLRVQPDQVVDKVDDDRKSYRCIRLTPSQARRLVVCGMSDCTCGGGIGNYDPYAVDENGDPDYDTIYIGMPNSDGLVIERGRYANN